MISEAIQVKCAGVITNTENEIINDPKLTPFCTHSAKESPMLLKSGTAGYSYEVEIFIVDKLPDSVRTLANSVITAIESLQGTTTNSTRIDSVQFEGDDPGFDQESQLYGIILYFTIETGNR